MKTYRAELHVHTVLSPCAEIEMIPPLIVMEAVERGIQLLAITDHNATANIAAVQQAAAGSGVTVLPGVEVQTREDVHVLCLFDTLEQAAEFQKFIDQHLPARQNEPDFFGEQLVVDSEGDFVAREKRLLLNSLNASIEITCVEAKRLGGLFIPAHADRQAYGLIPTLGMLPPGLEVDAVEVSRHIDPRQAALRFPQLKNIPIVQNGDAHRLNEIVGTMAFDIEAPTIAELRLAFQYRCGRAYTFLD